MAGALAGALRSLLVRRRPPLKSLLALLCLSVFGIMLPWFYLSSAATVSGLALANPASGAKHTGDHVDAWHAPVKWEVNSLDKVLNSEGVYGFIFNSSDTPDSDYGTYNYCNMPHVRAKEYIRPSKEYELQYVELIHRHHKRTPYADNSFPVESYQWNCNDQALYLYGQPLQGHDAAHGYRKGYISDVNPFTQSGWVGSCQFPQITPGGLQDSWQHGADLFGVYHGLLGFLPDNLTPKVRYRATNNVITHQVAGMVINGMWGITNDVPLNVQAVNVDSLEPQYSCPAASILFNAIKSKSNSEWQRHLDEAQDIYATLDDISGVPSDDSGFHVSFDHYFDNLSSRQCHDKPLPCKLVNGKNSSTCVTQELADTVYRLGHWEYSQMYRDNDTTLAASTGAYGVWVAELAVNLRAVIEGNRDVLYTHNIAHDGSVSRVLSLLQIDEMVWPGMGSEVVFELYKKGDGPGTQQTGSGFYVRVLFGGQVLKSSSPALGAIDMIPAGKLLDYFDSLVGNRASLIKAKCNA
ncbi:2-phosphoxylose phosphatase [Geosmithia morbida]|uniref:2-phosphoxylose phosphatase n=1 Tax=Geosmithia morbida TaxID=1094350 RepID=A0A9P5D391_9HYPO|nr:2-phosphoxylose phosphatase [Geosmithia morbida]KAF4125943.1 2-phosphoxylose phosphatase [Geosmithia morbida]